MAQAAFNVVSQKFLQHPNATKIVGGAAAAAMVGPFLAPVALGAAGFGAAGPVAGGIAATWQATMGNVVAGSAFAFFQSAAMGGAAAGTLNGIVTGAVAAVGAAGGYMAGNHQGEQGGAPDGRSTEHGQEAQEEEDETGAGNATEALEEAHTTEKS